MTVTTEVLEERLATVTSRIESQAVEIKALHAEIAELGEANVARERKALIAGISFLGSIILVLGGVLWQYRSVIFK